MLTKLGDAVGGWKPHATPGGDPLAAVRAAWADLVGVEVARAAQPVALQRDTVVVITASSSWSHQLAFLEPEIVRGIKALPEGREISRLRFRVGTVRATVPGVKASRPARPGRRSTPAGAEPPATTMVEAFERFRAAVRRSQAAHRNGGGRFCADCGAAVDTGARCVPCMETSRRAREAHCERLLYEAPWLRPEDVLHMVPGLDASEYDAIRRRLLRAWWDEMSVARKRAAVLLIGRHRIANDKQRQQRPQRGRRPRENGLRHPSRHQHRAHREGVSAPKHQRG
ncbi:MAG: DciA family protein, partial [Candidatus Velthaea sp.]